MVPAFLPEALHIHRYHWKGRGEGWRKDDLITAHLHFLPLPHNPVLQKNRENRENGEKRRRHGIHHHAYLPIVFLHFAFRYSLYYCLLETYRFVLFFCVVQCLFGEIQPETSLTPKSHSWAFGLRTRLTANFLSITAPKSTLWTHAGAYTPPG